MLGLFVRLGIRKVRNANVTARRVVHQNKVRTMFARYNMFVIAILIAVVASGCGPSFSKKPLDPTYGYEHNQRDASIGFAVPVGKDGKGVIAGTIGGAQQSGQASYPTYGYMANGQFVPSYGYGANGGYPPAGISTGAGYAGVAPGAATPLAAGPAIEYPAAPGTRLYLVRIINPYTRAVGTSLGKLRMVLQGATFQDFLVPEGAYRWSTSIRGAKHHSDIIDVTRFEGAKVLEIPGGNDEKGRKLHRAPGVFRAR